MDSEPQSYSTYSLIVPRQKTLSFLFELEAMNNGHLRSMNRPNGLTDRFTLTNIFFAFMPYMGVLD